MNQRFVPPSVTTRDHILDSAARVMHTLGLARATTKEIASAAGLSEAALYRYFSDKAELFLCVIGERLPELVATLKDLPARVGKRTVRSNLEDVIRVALPSEQMTKVFADKRDNLTQTAVMKNSGLLAVSETNASPITAPRGASRRFRSASRSRISCG